MAFSSRQHFFWPCQRCNRRRRHRPKPALDRFWESLGRVLIAAIICDAIMIAIEADPREIPRAVLHRVPRRAVHGPGLARPAPPVLPGRPEILGPFSKTPAPALAPPLGAPQVNLDRPQPAAPPPPVGRRLEAAPMFTPPRGPRFITITTAPDIDTMNLPKPNKPSLRSNETPT